MFPHTFALSAFVLALPLFAATSAVPRTEPVSQCNTGPIQCCKDTKEAKDSNLLGSVGINLGSIQGLVGEHCSPITLIGTGGKNPCTAQTVCCTNNNFNGVVALGCTPINIGA